MIKYLLPYIVLTFILAISCKKKDIYKDAITITSSDFGEFIELKGEQIDFDEIVYNPYKMIIKDSLLVIYNVRTEYAYQIFNLNTNKYLGESVLIGNGPGEMIYLNFIQSNDRNIWLYDQEKAIVYEYDIQTFIQTRSPLPKKTIYLDDRAEYLSIINDKIFSFKLYDNLNDNRFYIFDMEGKISSSNGRFPSIDQNMTYEEINFGFTSEYSTNFKDRILLSYRLTDLIEVYSLEGSLIKRIHGPEFFIPSVNEYKDESVSFANGTKEAKEAYFYPANAGDEVFITYSGELFSKNVFHKKQIYVFDWDGNPQRRYLLDIPIYGTIVDSQKRIIYGFSDIPEFHVVKFHY
ncbi:MAG: BF3164 family lipoprotein [Dysgonomonas sp.]